MFKIIFKNMSLIGLIFINTELNVKKLLKNVQFLSYQNLEMFNGYFDNKHWFKHSLKCLLKVSRTRNDS